MASASATATRITTPVARVNKERGEWAEPEQMNQTYALLYNTLTVNNASFIPIQMDERIWRLVYGPAKRDRTRCWANTSFRDPTFHYRIIHQTEEGGVRTEMVRVDAPQRVYDRTTGRSFEVQDDGFLCGTHGLNNVANTVILTPPDHLGAIEDVRPLYSKQITREELTLAALREGVFLLSVKLTDASDLNSLDSAERFPRNKCFLDLLERARGMIILTQYSVVKPKKAYSESGKTAPQVGAHYVSLVLAEPSTGGVDPARRWLIFSMAKIESAGATAADAVDKYILNTLTGLTFEEKTREERRRRLERENIDPVNFEGLLPISLRLLFDDANLAERAATRRPLAAEELAHLVLVRSLLRRQLSDLRLISFTIGNETMNELSAVKPVSPNGIDELCAFIDRTAPTSANDDDEADDLTYTGLDQTNMVSFLLKRHAADAMLNMQAEIILRFVVSENKAGWVVDPILSTNEAAAQEGVLEPIKNRYTEVLQALRTVRSYAPVDSTDVLGLVMTGSPIGDRNQFNKFSRLMANRRWLRWIAITLAANSLAELFESIIVLAAYPLNVTVRRILTLLGITLFSNLKGYGVRLETTPSVSQIYSLLRRDRTALLPLDSLPEQIANLVRTGEIAERGEFATLFMDKNYEWYLWLMQSALDADLPNFLLPSVQPFIIRDTGGQQYDDLTVAYDRRAAFVELVRETLFRMPAYDQDHSVLRAAYTEQNFNMPTREPIAQLFRAGALEFVRRSVDAGFLPDANTALEWIDVLAFDRRYGTDAWRAATQDLSTHTAITEKPRFAERAALAGYDVIRSNFFGRLHLLPDQRRPITNNINRLPLPRTPGQWQSTRPIIAERVRLCTTPLSELPMYVNRYDRGVQATSSKRARTAAPAGDLSS